MEIILASRLDIIESSSFLSQKNALKNASGNLSGSGLSKY